MKLNRYIWVLLSLVLLVTGCIKDTIYTSCPFGTDALLKLNMPEAETEVRSYALSEADEHKLDAVDVLVFKDNGTGSDNETFVYATTPTAINNAAGTYNKTVKVLFNESGTDKHRIVLLANARDKISNFDDIITGFTTATTKQAALNQIRFANNGVWATAGTTLPMWGEMEETVVIGPNTVYTAIDMLRSLARIDVGINMDAAGTPQGLGDLFKLTKVRVYNSNNLALTAPFTVNYNFGSVILPSIPAAPAPGKNSPIEYLSTIPTGTLGFVREIYTAEVDNKNQSVNNNRLVLLAGGYYTAPGSGSVNTTTETWYRIDFNDASNNALDVLRNYRYFVNIKEVNGAGQTTPEEAFNQPSYIGTEVIPWDEFLYSTTVTGSYTLEVSPLNLTCDYTAQTIGNAVGNELTITTDYSSGWEVEKITEVVGGVETELTTGNFWLQPAGGVSISGGAGVSRMNIELTENTGTEPRVGKIYIKAGRWTQAITVEQGIYQGIDVNPSNCYILAPGGVGINIPVSRANEAMPGSIGTTDELTAELLWTDNPAGMQSVSGNANASIKNIKVLGRGATGRVQVIPGATKLGNAVVVVKVGGVVKWSWHIWVTNYNPNTLSNYLLPLAAGDKEYVVPNGYVGAIASGTTVIPDGYDPQTFGPGSWSYAPAVMDRSIGCTEGSWEALYSNYAPTGLFFQWGRKDPFTGSGSITQGSSTLAAPIYDAAGSQISFNNISGGGLAATIANPGALSYNYKADDGSWGYTVDSNPWAMYPWDSSAGKSVYDPCPEGWMVERHGFWTKFIREGSFKLNRAGTLGTTTMSRRAEVAFGAFSLSGYIVPGTTTNTYADVSENAALWAATGKVSNNTITDYAYCCLLNYEFDISGTYYSFPEGSLNRSYGAQVRCMKEYKFD